MRERLQNNTTDYPNHKNDCIQTTFECDDYQRNRVEDGAIDGSNLENVLIGDDTDSIITSVSDSSISHNIEAESYCLNIQTEPEMYSNNTIDNVGHISRKYPGMECSVISPDGITNNFPIYIDNNRI